MEQDHKEIGRKLGLFSFSRSVPGTAYWWPKGNTLFNLIVNNLKAQLKNEGYEDINTPAIISAETLKKSGHYDNYFEKLFFTGNQKELKAPKWCLKPMNCPGGISIFNEDMRSYKDLPIKFSEVGTVYRYEQPGEVNGLLRTRALTIDDAHIFCTEEQIEAELIKLIDFIQDLYQFYGFKVIRVELSTRPEKSIGTDIQWEKAESGLVAALKDSKMDYKVNKGDGAFYGPKIDFHVKDSHGRSWQMGTIQLDFSTAERLEAFYVNVKGEKQNPVIIHRAILGSVERFIAVLLEHTGGEFPVWLSPIQATILPVSDKHLKYAQEVGKELGDIRFEIDERNESVGKKIRDAELQKIPYIIVVGAKEEKDNNLTLRSHSSKELKTLSVKEFVKTIERSK